MRILSEGKEYYKINWGSLPPKAYQVFFLLPWSSQLTPFKRLIHFPSYSTYIPILNFKRLSNKTFKWALLRIVLQLRCSISFLQALLVSFLYLQIWIPRLQQRFLQPRLITTRDATWRTKIKLKDLKGKRHQRLRIRHLHLAPQTQMLPLLNSKCRPSYCNFRNNSS